MARREVAVGDRFTDKSGRALVVVNAIQPRQTRAYDVTGSYYEDIESYTSESNWATDDGEFGGGPLSWPLKNRQGRMKEIRPGSLLLCAIEEWDIPTNEFGKVLP